MRLDQLAADLNSNLRRNNEEILNQIMSIAMNLQKNKNETDEVVIAIKDELKAIEDPNYKCLTLGCGCTTSPYGLTPCIPDPTPPPPPPPACVVYSCQLLARNSTVIFYLDCDGTTGWMNMSDFRTTTSNDSRSLGYWSTLGVYAETDFRQPGGNYTIIT
jgi:hypothetical protein